MPRFAILRHDCPQGLHFDLLLQTGDVLQTWSLPRVPESGVDMPCEPLPEHRSLYLDYEGPISGGRGSVSRWDRGSYEILHRSESKLQIAVDGDTLRGQVTIEQASDQCGEWRFSFLAARPRPPVS